jgi:hypothetical protein
MRRARRTLLLALAGFALLSGSAVAFWAASGSGSGSGSTDTSAAVTLSGAAPATFLYPGASADVTASVDNPNGHPVHVASLVLDTAQDTNGFSANATGCALTFTTQTNGGSGFTIPSGTSSLTLADALAMGAGADDACQGEQFTVHLKAGP